MRKQTLSFNQLVEKNKQDILEDKLEMEKIERQIDKKHEFILESTKKVKS